MSPESAYVLLEAIAEIHGCTDKLKLWEMDAAEAKEQEELDFSMGDTIMHSDTSSCWDCSWDKDIDQFMWTIRITRIPE